MSKSAKTLAKASAITQDERSLLLKLYTKKIAIAMIIGKLCELPPATYELVAEILGMLNVERDLADQVLAEVEQPKDRSPTFQKQPISKELRWQILERDNFTCHYCGSRRHLVCDHKVPESQGGTHDPSNLVTSCKLCNSRKGTKSYDAFVAGLTEDDDA